MGKTGADGGASRRVDGRGWLTILAVAAIAIALRVIAFAPFDISHADELMQYLEQGNRLATGHGIVPWEARFGLRNALIPQLLALPFWIGHRLAPGTLTGFLLARALFAALTLIALPAAWRLGALTSRRHALAALFVVAIWWESVLYSDLVLSESLSAAILLLAAALLLDDEAGPKAIGTGGFLLGLGVLVRLQFAPFAAVLALWVLWHDRSRWWPLLAGGVAAAVLGAISDLARGAVPYSWILVNFDMNIGEGRAAGFGTSGPLQYFAYWYLHFGGAALIFVGLCALMAGRRYLPLLLAAVVVIAAHSLIGHKEYRFVWIGTLTLLVLAAIGSVNLATLLVRRRNPAATEGWMPLAITLAIWTLLSLSSFHITGGYAAFRGGGRLSKLAIMAAERPEVCRIAIANDYYAHVVPSILPRAVPLSIAPKGVSQGNRPLPPELAGAANALLMAKRPPGTEPYREVACAQLPEERPCLYIRPGTCMPAPVYDYQTVRARDGM